MSKPHPVIRPGQPTDFEAIQRLNAELFKFELPLNDHSRNPNWPFTEEGIAYFKKCINRQDGCAAFVAEISGKIVGYLTASVYTRLWMAANPVAEIETIFVEPEYRHQGIGTSLTNAFKAWAHEQRAGRLKVGALVANHPAMDFYQRQGFKPLVCELEQPGDTK
jgi:GNAT superfamily N-acetyltransferase